jgi:polysaccharide pyruvyl transferase WcaK-like protein
VRIGVFGHVGHQNLGDEALIAAVVQNVRRRYPGAELRAFTGRPQDTERRHGIPAFPIRRMNGHLATAPAVVFAADPPGRQSSALGGAWGKVRTQLKRVPLIPPVVRATRRVGRWALAVPLELAFLARSYRNLRGTDLLLIAGSQQLNDYWGGPWAFPFTLFKWLLLARASGTKVAFLSVGAGPLRTRLGKFFVKQTLRLAHYCSYRDRDARQCIVALGVPGEHVVVPDLVFSLQVGRVPPAPARVRPRMVGINPMPFLDGAYWPESDPPVYGHYIRTLASFADGLLESGYGVQFFATQLLVDHGVIGEIRGLMRQGVAATGPERVVADRIASFDDLVSVIDSLDVVVATRYHGTLIALIRHKPVLCIAYQRKSAELMTQVGQAEYGVDIGRVTLETLRERFLALEGRGVEFAEAVRRRLPAIRRALETQYDRAFALIDTAS